MGCCFNKTNKVSDVVDVVVQPNLLKKDPPNVLKKDQPNVLKKELVERETIPAKPKKSSSSTNLRVKKHDHILRWKEKVDALNANQKLANYCSSMRRSNLTTLDELTNFFRAARLTVAKRDVELAWCIYVWLTQNIKYDGASLKNKSMKNNSPENVLNSGLAVCAGYANLFKFLCDGNQIECLVLPGYAKGFGYEPGQEFTQNAPDHAWNAIKLKDRWYYVEATWGAGNLTDDYQFNQKFNPYYFLTPEIIFLNDHYSTEHMDKLDLIAPKFTLNDFQEKPRFRIDYYLLDLNCMSHSELEKKKNTIESDTSIIFVEFKSRYKLKLLGKLIQLEPRQQPSKGASAAAGADDSVLLMTDFSDSAFKKYGFIVFLADGGSCFKMEIYAKHLSEKRGDETSLPLVHELRIEKSANFKLNSSDPTDRFKVKIPKYQLSLQNESGLDLKLLSHSSQFIIFEQEVLLMKFGSSSQTASLIANLSDMDPRSQKLSKSLTLVQKNFAIGQILVYCSVPDSSKRYKLSVFAKDLKDRTSPTDNKHAHVKDFHVVRNVSSSLYPPGGRQLITLYMMTESEFCIQQPLVYELERNRVYYFSVLIKNSPTRVGLEMNNAWTYFEQDKATLVEWRVEKSFDTAGEITLYVNYEPKKNYEALTKYFVK